MRKLKNSELERLTPKQYKITNNNGQEQTINGDEIIKLPDGSLTTMYHYLKNSNKEIEEIISSVNFENAKS